MALTDWTRKGIAHMPIEARMIRLVVKSLKAAGTPVVKVWDSEEWEDTPTRDDVLNAAFNLDECFLYTESGSWVRIVMGNDIDCVVDYTLDLEEALAPVDAYWEKHS